MGTATVSQQSTCHPSAVQFTAQPAKGWYSRLLLGDMEFTGKFASIARRHMDSSTSELNCIFLRNGIKKALSFHPSISLAKFESFCKSAQGLQERPETRLLSRLMLGNDLERADPTIAIDVYSSAMECPPAKRITLATCIYAILCFDPKCKFQKSPGKLLSELVSHFSLNSKFLPKAILDYVDIGGGTGCTETKNLFKDALEKNTLIKTTLQIGGKAIPVYIKGVVSNSAVLAYSLQDNAVYLLDRIKYGAISLNQDGGRRTINCHKFRHDDLKTAIESAEKANKKPQLS